MTYSVTYTFNMILYLLQVYFKGLLQLTVTRTIKNLFQRIFSISSNYALLVCFSVNFHVCSQDKPKCASHCISLYTSKIPQSPHGCMVSRKLQIALDTKILTCLTLSQRKLSCYTPFNLPVCSDIYIVVYSKVYVKDDVDDV